MRVTASTWRGNTAARACAANASTSKISRRGPQTANTPISPCTQRVNARPAAILSTTARGEKLLRGTRSKDWSERGIGGVTDWIGFEDR